MTLFGYGGVYLAGNFRQTPHDFSYLEDEKNIKSLAEDMKKISERSETKRSPASSTIQLLSESTYTDFLNPSNPYHVLLSYRISNQIDGKVLNSSDESIDVKIKNYETKMNLDYHNELRLILISGNFLNHSREEDFIIGQFSSNENNEIISAIHDKLINNLHSYNSTNLQDMNQFKRLLEIYIDKIHQSELNELQLRAQMAAEIKSPVILNFFNETWELSQKKFDESPALDFSDDQNEPQNSTDERLDTGSRDD